MTLVETETIFERIVTGNDVEQWVLSTLQKWSSTYLSELERQHGYKAGTLQRPRGWVLAPSFDKWPEDQLPAVLVVCTGLIPPPARYGDGRHSARWNVEIGCCCSARTQQQSHEQAMLFVAAHRAIILQRSSLDGRVLATTWLDESYDVLDYDDVRTLYAGTATFDIEVENVTTSLAGPATPDPLDDPTLPWPGAPIVLSHEEIVENYPDDQPLPAREGT